MIEVPLRENDEAVQLDLQALLELCYRNGGYDDDIDYENPPVPPLTPADARWADALLRKQGKRTATAARKPGRQGKKNKRQK